MVAVDEHVIGHKWFFLDDVPTAVDVQSAAVAWAGDAGAAGEKLQMTARVDCSLWTSLHKNNVHRPNA